MHWGVDAFNGFLTFIEFQIEAFPVLQGRYWSHSREDRGVQQGAKQATVRRVHLQDEATLDSWESVQEQLNRWFR